MTRDFRGKIAGGIGELGEEFGFDWWFVASVSAFGATKAEEGG